MHADQGLARLADTADIEVRLGEGVEVVVVALGEIEVGQLAVAGGQEAGEQAIVRAASCGDALQPLDAGLSFAGVVGRDLHHVNTDLAADRTSDGRY